MPTTSLRPATASDRPVLEHLWQMFRHDLSQMRGVMPGPDGRFRSERLEAAFTDPDWTAYLLLSDDRPAGFAVVRGLTADTRVLSAFFIVRGARRRGLGLQAAVDLIRRHPGQWEVAFQDENAAATRFWPRVATRIADDEWTLEHRPVPDRPDVPPDIWISFSVSL